MITLRHIFFDLDRTLWDFETNSKNALQKLYNLHQLSDHFNHFIHFYTIYRNINNELWKKYGKGKISKDELRITRFQKTLERVNNFDIQFADQLNKDYVLTAPRETILFPNTIETLNELKKRYQLHIITNGFEEAQIIKLKSAKILNYFNVIVCSEMVGKTKPHRDIFHYALLQAKAKSNESIMIGDDHTTDILGAIQVGMQAILFDPNEKYRKSAGQHKIKDLSELPMLLTLI